MTESHDKSQHIAVLMGGMSAEREVSLSSGKAVCAALEGLGYRVSAVDAGHDVAEQLRALRPDCVFNALHGRYGEDGCVQGVLEMLKTPYTHSGVLASALAMDKPLAKQVFAYHGLPCAEGVVVDKQGLLAGDPLPRPYVVKPLNEGSSVGVYIVREGDALPFSEAHWPFGARVLVEAFFAGREIQVAVLNGVALGAIEIRPKSGFYDYEAKYTDGKAEHIMPAPISEAAYARALSMAESAHNALGCRGLSRSDLMYDDARDVFVLLETNTQPGMTPLSLAPEIAAHAGIDFAALMQALLDDAGVDK